jgi:redox-sensitive bicupin YhaK (pirin superfamily)
MRPGRDSDFGAELSEEVTMSFFRGQDPAAGDAFACDAIAHLIVPRTVDLGDFSVRRAMPSAKSRMVGPFIFFDHFGPAQFKSGAGLDVRPHPHIGLATVTYLFDGEIMHRDSLGTVAAIRPGEINWMTAGHGIVHSERTAPEHRVDGEPLHGLQCWVALPHAKEEMAPDFVHYGVEDFPLVSDTGKTARVLAGEAYGARSPLSATSETMFVDVALEAGARLPIDARYEERAVYVVSGEIEIMGDRFGEHRLLVLRPGDAITLTALGDARVTLVGGEPMDGPRHIWWNFVSSRKERIEEAKQQWKTNRFDPVPDEVEFIPLPENRPAPDAVAPGNAA